MSTIDPSSTPPPPRPALRFPLGDPGYPTFGATAPDAEPFTLEALEAVVAAMSKPTPSDVVRIELAEARQIDLVVQREDSAAADLRRLGMLPPAAVTGLPVVVDPSCPPNVVRLVARDGSTAAYDLTTGRAIVVPAHEVGP